MIDLTFTDRFNRQPEYNMFGQSLLTQLVPYKFRISIDICGSIYCGSVAGEHSIFGPSYFYFSAFSHYYLNGDRVNKDSVVNIRTFKNRFINRAQKRSKLSINKCVTAVLGKGQNIDFWLDGKTCCFIGGNTHSSFGPAVTDIDGTITYYITGNKVSVFEAIIG